MLLFHLRVTADALPNQTPTLFIEVLNYIFIICGQAFFAGSSSEQADIKITMMQNRKNFRDMYRAEDVWPQLRKFCGLMEVIIAFHRLKRNRRA